MGRTTQQETLALYTRTLKTMSDILEVLREERDLDGTVANLATRIGAEREWVRFLMALGETPTRPPDWLRGVPPALVRDQRRVLTQTPRIHSET